MLSSPSGEVATKLHCCLDRGKPLINQLFHHGSQCVDSLRLSAELAVCHCCFPLQHLVPHDTAEAAKCVLELETHSLGLPDDFADDMWQATNVYAFVNNSEG